MVKENASLVLENLCLSKDGRNIINHLSLSIPKNYIYSLLGPNGAGKSSLAYTLMGLDDYQLNSGKIIFDGLNITKKPSWQRCRLGISMAWQDPPIFDGLSIGDYLQISAENRKEHGDLEYCLNIMELEPKKYLDRTMGAKLSGGERKRIELASTLIASPKLAILDEPDSGIDMVSIGTIQKAIGYLKKNGSTILLITHNEEVAGLSDRVGLLCGGCLEGEGEKKNMVELFKTKCGRCRSNG
ncbi:MAG: ATP-binding cassette domain-containing protein [Candidatus Omnitrophica bacterium]|nr:ATP-binding cassette domain-containing protein [Candidatus Omnitrophota bacterium]